MNYPHQDLIPSGSPDPESGLLPLGFLRGLLGFFDLGLGDYQADTNSALGRALVSMEDEGTLRRETLGGVTYVRLDVCGFDELLTEVRLVSGVMI